MAPEGKPLVIALEEHYYDPELAATFDGPEGRAPETRRRLDDLGELRLKEMDEAGIDVQVISHGAPSTQRLDPETAVRLARNANDRLAQAIAAHPDRFAGSRPCRPAYKMRYCKGLQYRMIYLCVDCPIFGKERTLSVCAWVLIRASRMSCSLTMR